MMKFEYVLLSDYYDIGSGLSKSASEFGFGFPFLSFSTIFNNYFVPLELSLLVNSSLQEQNSCSVKKGDVFLTRTSETVEELGMSSVALKDYPKATFNGFTKRLRPNDLGKKEIDPKFIGFYLRSIYFRAEITAYSSLTTRASLNNGIINKLKIHLPPLPIQRKIAAVLSAYDDLIENNNRRIAILEKMAEELYREWFVRLRFPGHEKVKVVKGVPEGWEVKKISEVVDFLSGFSFKSKTYLPNAKHGIVTIKNVQDGFFVNQCTDFVDDYPSNMKTHCKLNTGDVLMSLTGNVGRICHVIGEDFLLNQRVAKLKEKATNSSQFIFYTFRNRSMVQLIENLSLGSTAQMNLSPIQLGKQKILVPNKELLHNFENNVFPITDQKIFLLKSNEKLRSIRDRLLSRLMSGKIDVENLDIQFPESMHEDIANA